jgi:acyl-CoA synthetase (AMP-forming)/AMP-acid ligase II/NAD(P)-dependent dehydrogenase (short-subunit alcohol dehydrogenase family)
VPRLAEIADRAGQRAARALSHVVNPHGGPAEHALRAAVEGKVVLVTGASYGIGEASARKLGAAGAVVLLVARTGERLEEVRRDIEAGGGRAVVYTADLRDPVQVEQLGARLLERHGAVDVVVNNAGKSIRRPLAESDDRFHDFERTIDVNYLGPVRLLLALLPSMRERGRGHIVNVSTVGVSGLPPAPGWTAYQASKAAFDVFLRAAAPELRAFGVTTTSIYMTLVHSRMSAPIRMWRYLPGMLPEEAGDLVCRAIVERPRAIGPWWRKPGDVTNALFPGTVESLLDTGYRLTINRSRPAGESRGGAAELVSRARSGVAVATAATGAAVRSGMLAPPVRPDRVVRTVRALRQSPGPAMAGAIAAARYPDRAAVIDERGGLTFAELDEQCRRIAASLASEYGVGPDRGLAVMCRNHRGFVMSALAATRVGADLLLLNTDFSAPQLAQSLAPYKLGAIVHDREFEERFANWDCPTPRVLGFSESGAGVVTLEALAEHATGRAQAGPAGKIVILTSGTTGTPKGAPRHLSPLALAGVGISMVERMHLRAGEPLLVAPPFFHGFGLLGLGAALTLGSPVVCERRYDAARMLALTEQHQVRALFAVPVMLKRILELPDSAHSAHNVSSLRVVLSGGSPLNPSLASEFMDTFGEILFNGYGSSEVGVGTLATPADLRAAPGTVGRPVHGITVKILGADERELLPREIGRVFVGSRLLFEGYTGGGSKDIVGALMSTGDLGHFDDHGRLFIDGREDDMIVSGGENVFPGEVEETLSRHAAVADVAVISVDDEDFGQRLAAFVVPTPEATLSEDELKQHVKSSLARYKVPREIHFLDELPRNPTGKLLRTQLRDMSREGRA